MTWESAASIATILGVLVPAFAALHYRVIRPCARKIHALLALLPQVQLLVAELSKNGGSSIKDKIDKIDHNVNGRVDAIDDEIKKRIANIDTLLNVIQTRNRILQDFVDIGIYECDVTGRCTFANTKLCAMFGLSRSQMLGNGWLVSVADDDRHRVWKEWMTAVRGGIPYSTTYDIINQETGDRMHVRTQATWIQDSTGAIQAYHGTIWKDEPGVA